MPSAYVGRQQLHNTHLCTLFGLERISRRDILKNAGRTTEESKVWDITTTQIRHQATDTPML